MINLLPPQLKELLAQEHNKKVVMILGITAIAPLICMGLILLSIKFYLLGEVNSQKAILEQARQKYQTEDFLNYKGIIQKNNSVLAQIKSFYDKEFYAGDVLDMILNLSRSQTLYFTDFSLDRTADQKMKIILSGKSDTRENLLLLQKSMQTHPEIQNLNFSPESWVNPTNVRFYVTFEVSPTP